MVWGGLESFQVGHGEANRRVEIVFVRTGIELQSAGLADPADETEPEAEAGGGHGRGVTVIVDFHNRVAVLHAA